MEERKTLVEQLRDMVELSTINDQHPTVHADAILGHLCVSRGDERELFTAIADRIEREYMPLPMLEGEPLKVGDRVDGYFQEGAEVVAVMNSDMVVVRSTVKGGYGYHDEAYPLLLWSVKEVKRPEPEVLDADGVPINVGDTVWTVYSGEKEKVAGILLGKRIAIESGGWRRSVDLTHKHPDSLERIEEDARKMYSDYWGCGYAECHCCPVEVDGKRPWERYETTNGCLIAQKLDLLRRQREVLERGQA